MLNPLAAELLSEASAAVRGEVEAKPGASDRVRAGVDLGTATMVLLVLDEAGRPLAGRLRPAGVVRDGVVFDFIGAVDHLQAMKAEVEAELGLALRRAASGFPPGVPQPEVRAVANVLGNAGFETSALIDEPSAANQVLGLRHGVIVDIGGGTTGLSILQDGQVVYTADEPTGGLHFNLVIAGALGVSLEQAERLKETPAEQARLFALVRPVMEKVGSIIDRHIQGWPVQRIWLVGGASTYPGISGVIEEATGIETDVAPEAQLVTPLGIALADGELETMASLSAIAGQRSR